MARRGAAELAKLKEAEAEALSIVAAAREERKAKMRAAQADAKREIDEYRALREQKLRTVNPEARALDDKIARISAETDSKIAQLKGEYDRNKADVIDMLVKLVISIDNPYAAAQ